MEGDKLPVVFASKVRFQPGGLVVHPVADPGVGVEDGNVRPGAVEGVPLGHAEGVVIGAAVLFVVAEGREEAGVREDRVTGFEESLPLGRIVHHVDGVAEVKDKERFFGGDAFGNEAMPLELGETLGLLGVAVDDEGEFSAFREGAEGAVAGSGTLGDDVVMVAGAGSETGEVYVMEVSHRGIVDRVLVAAVCGVVGLVGVLNATVRRKVGPPVDRGRCRRGAGDIRSPLDCGGRCGDGDGCRTGNTACGGGDIGRADGEGLEEAGGVHRADRGV